MIAIDRGTGAIVWSKVAYDGPMYDDRHKMSSFASPTIATDGERVFAYFGSPGLYVYDLAGNQLWTRDVGDIKTIGMGVGTSPVLSGGRVFIQADEDEGKESFLVALDAKDGKRSVARQASDPGELDHAGGGRGLGRRSHSSSPPATSRSSRTTRRAAASCGRSTGWRRTRSTCRSTPTAWCS